MIRGFNIPRPRSRRFVYTNVKYSEVNLELGKITAGHGLHRDDV